MRNPVSTAIIALAVNSILASNSPNAEGLSFDDKDTFDDGASYELIEVWAQKQKQFITEVPVSMQVLTFEQLQNLGSINFEEVEHHLPAVFASPNSAASKVFIRGIGSQGNAGMDQNTSLYIDNIYHGRSRMIKSNLFDSQQLEVLKGPQSLHFGLNSTAGAFSVRTIGASTNKTAGYLQGQVGDNQTWGFGLAKNITISHSSAVRVAMRLKQSDGYWDMLSTVTGEKVAESDTEEQLYRLSGLWLSDSVTVRLKVESQKADRQNPYAWQPTGCSNLYGLGFSTQNELDVFWQTTGSQDNNPLRVPFTCRATFVDNQADKNSPASPFNSSSFSYNILQSNILWQLSDFKTELTSAWYDTEFDFSGNDLSHGANFHRILSSTDNIHQHSHELRLFSDSQQSVNWTAGVYWHNNYIYYDTTDVDGRRRMQEQVSIANVVQNEERLSLFATLDWQFYKNLTVSPGIRWATTDKKFSGTDRAIQVQRQPEPKQDALSTLIKSDVLADPTLYDNFTSQLRSEFSNENLGFSGLMPSLVLAWQQSETQHWYYKWQKGLKGGGFNFRLNNLDESHLRYREETVYAQELGFKSTMKDNEFVWSAVLFQSHYTDLQQNSNQGEDGFIGGAYIRNIARSSSDGLELELVWQPDEAFNIRWQSTWLNADFDNYPGADCTRLQSVVSNTDVANQFGAYRAQNCYQDLSGQSMPMAPEFASGVTLAYSQPIFDEYNLSTHISWHYSDEFFTSPHADPLRKQNSYHKANLYISLEPGDKQWKLSLYINNLTDKLTSRQLGQDGNAAVSALMDPPRYWFLQGTWQI